MRSILREAAGAAAPGSRLLHADGSVARVRTWPDTPTVAQLVMVDHGAAPSATALARWWADLMAAGFRRVRTGALGPTMVGAFLDAGFVVIQELVLLEHGLGGRFSRREPDGITLRRPHHGDLVELAHVDRRAFGAPWHLDVAGIVDACQATPVHRLRVATDGDMVVGYAVSGRAGTASYLQRLAVSPTVQRRGVGRALTLDSLTWARRRHGSSMLVNTHVGNEGALALYRSLGFAELGYRLSVCERTGP